MDKKVVGYGCLWIVIGLIALSFLSPSGPKPATAADAMELQKQRNDFKARVKTAGPLGNRVLACTARRVSNRTVETTYLMWINDRADLTTREDRESTANDTVSSIEACGGNMTALAREMKADDENLIFKGLAISMLEAGR